MIVAVKRQSFKKLAIKVLSIAALIGMFTAYYFHMSGKFQEDKIEQPTSLSVEQAKHEKRAKEIERIIYKEAEVAVDLIDQEHIQNIRVVANKLYIVCDVNTNLDALMVRYGVMALVKNSVSDIKIAIDLKQIVESKYKNEDN
ncbi:MAG: hypothetical protein ACNI3C_05745 [Candidatus Marinarcus sp.]|uniref:hypothetical protein n=1 Tax=Candidatus Marinarcus sp. TaxID=3100987 RepID=UPI003AFF741E